MAVLIESPPRSLYAYFYTNLPLQSKGIGHRDVEASSAPAARERGRGTPVEN